MRSASARRGRGAVRRGRGRGDASQDAARELIAGASFTFQISIPRAKPNFLRIHNTVFIALPTLFVLCCERAMYSGRRGRGCVRAAAARWRLGAALGALALALCVRLPREHLLVAHFPQHTPKQLAHFLADFSNYPNLYKHIDSWSIEEESGNYTAWRYVASYGCGPRCTGRADVSAHNERTPPAEPHAHRLYLHDVHCTRLPLLYWPQFCEEIEVESEIVSAAEAARLGAEGAEGAGGAARGSRLAERARAWCGALQLLAGRCAPRHSREAHLYALRHSL
ncbi:unnamed protein product [Colias eurytheme]|nr:unnamed protein product [Colias eurytheme]